MNSEVMLHTSKGDSISLRRWETVRQVKIAFVELRGHCTDSCRCPGAAASTSALSYTHLIQILMVKVVSGLQLMKHLTNLICNFDSVQRPKLKMMMTENMKNKYMRQLDPFAIGPPTCALDPHQASLLTLLHDPSGERVRAFERAENNQKVSRHRHPRHG